MHLGYAVGQRVPASGPEVFIQLRGSGIGDDAEHQPHGLIFQHTCRFALCIAHNSAAGRYNGLRVHARQFQGLAVGKSHMPIVAGNEDRVITGNGINPFFTR